MFKLNLKNTLNFTYIIFLSLIISFGFVFLQDMGFYDVSLQLDTSFSASLPINPTPPVSDPTQTDYIPLIVTLVVSALILLIWAMLVYIDYRKLKKSITIDDFAEDLVNVILKYDYVTVSDLAKELHVNTRRVANKFMTTKNLANTHELLKHDYLVELGRSNEPIALRKIKYKS